jgi:hypothetical protein
MSELKTAMILRRAPGVRLLIGADDEVRVRVGEQERDCGAHALAILDVFSRPRPLAEALDELRPRLTGMADWVDLMAALERLYGLGALVDQAGAGRRQGPVGRATPEAPFDLRGVLAEQASPPRPP